MDLAQANWKRRNQPVLSAMTTDQDWCRVTLYRAGDGTIKADGAGIYRHIGVAMCAKE